MMTPKIWFDSLNEIKELDYMEHEYMHMKGHRRGPGTSSR